MLLGCLGSLILSKVFGNIKQISMIPNPENGKHKVTSVSPAFRSSSFCRVQGYGFIEYEKHEDAVQAIQSAEGGGRRLFDGDRVMGGRSGGRALPCRSLRKRRR
eukprot:762639-Hanusia_phi.AAC.14